MNNNLPDINLFIGLCFVEDRLKQEVLQKAKYDEYGHVVSLSTQVLPSSCPHHTSTRRMRSTWMTCSGWNRTKSSTRPLSTSTRYDPASSLLPLCPVLLGDGTPVFRPLTPLLLVSAAKWLDVKGLVLRLISQTVWNNSERRYGPLSPCLNTRLGK